MKYPMGYYSRLLMMKEEREILESYTKCSCNVKTSHEILQHICKDLDVPVSKKYCYISDLLKFLLETEVIILNNTQINKIRESRGE